MAQYTKATDEKGTTRYKDGNKFVKGDDVPANIKAELEKHDDGTVIDETGEVVDPETDTDEGSGDETPEQVAAREKAEADAKAEQDERDRQANESVPNPRNLNANRPPESEDHKGMGFPMDKHGNTLDIFDGKSVATHIRGVGELVVPLTEENYLEKSDSEILDRVDALREKGKVTV